MSGRIVFVTGVTAGFGEAIARRALADGDRVIGAGRRVERLEALAAELGDRFLPVPLDVADRDAVLLAVDALPDDWAAIDVLVANAGMALGLDAAWEADLDDWDTMIAVNCRGLATTVRAVLPGMVARGRGHIVLLSSVAASRPYPGGNVYGATKAFVSQLGDNLRADLAGRPVRVTTLEPGLCGGTEFSLVRFHGDAGRAAAPYRGVDPITPADIAEAVAWVTGLPAHVNVNRMEIMPVAQTFGPLPVRRAE